MLWMEYPSAEEHAFEWPLQKQGRHSSALYVRRPLLRDRQISLHKKNRDWTK